MRLPVVLRLLREDVVHGGERANLAAEPPHLPHRHRIAAGHQPHIHHRGDDLQVVLDPMMRFRHRALQPLVQRLDVRLMPRQRLLSPGPVRDVQHHRADPQRLSALGPHRVEVRQPVPRDVRRDVAPDIEVDDRLPGQQHAFQGRFDGGGDIRQGRL